MRRPPKSRFSVTTVHGLEAPLVVIGKGLDAVSARDAKAFFEHCG